MSLADVLTNANVPQNYDFYPYTAVESRLPEAAKPYLNEFREFIEVSYVFCFFRVRVDGCSSTMQHNHYVILRKVLGIISLGLNMPIDT